MPHWARAMAEVAAARRCRGPFQALCAGRELPRAAPRSGSTISQLHHGVQGRFRLPTSTAWNLAGLWESSELGPSPEESVGRGAGAGAGCLTAPPFPSLKRAEATSLPRSREQKALQQPASPARRGSCPASAHVLRPMAQAQLPCHRPATSQRQPSSGTRAWVGTARRCVRAHRRARPLTGN